MRLARCLLDGQELVAVVDEEGVAPTGYDDMLALIREEDEGLRRARETAAPAALRPILGDRQTWARAKSHSSAQVIGARKRGGGRVCRGRGWR